MIRALLKGIGVYGYLVFALGVAVFIGGEIQADPKASDLAIKAIALLVPVVALTVIGFRNGGWAKAIFASSAVVMAILVFATALIPDQWATFENSHGPWLGIALFALTIPLAIWARVQPLEAGVLMICAGVAPLLEEALESAGLHVGGSAFALATPGIIAGVLVVLSTVFPARNQ